MEDQCDSCLFYGCKGSVCRRYQFIKLWWKFPLTKRLVECAHIECKYYERM